jgi:hypothetical protein
MMSQDSLGRVRMRAALLMVVAGICVLLARCAFAVEAMNWDEDWGEVYAGEVVKKDFLITNTSEKVLTVKVRTDCKCGSATLDKSELKPTEQAKVQLKYRFDGKSGQKTVTVYVHYGDDEKKESGVTKLKAKALLSDDISLVPMYLYSGIVRQGQTRDYRIVIEATEGLVSRVGRIGFQKPVSYAKPSKAEEITEHGRIKRAEGREFFIITLGAAFETDGEFQDDITITLVKQNGKEKEISVPFYGDVLPGVSAMPSTAFFGRIVPGAVARRQLRLRQHGEAPIEVSGVSFRGMGDNVSTSYELLQDEDGTVVVLEITGDSHASGTVTGFADVEYGDGSYAPTVVPIIVVFGG